MAANNEILRSVRALNRQGNDISTKMVDFLNNVKTHPLGFRELGLDFLEICRIVSTLKDSLEEHFQTNQPFPEHAIPELMKVFQKTLGEFKKLDELLQKFRAYESGGAIGKMQKTWRLVFADKEVTKAKTGLQENKGALRMTMLLTNINPNWESASVKDEYRALATRLALESRLPAELESTSPVPVSTIASSFTDHTTSSDTDKILIPSASELTIDDGLIPIDADSSPVPNSAVTRQDAKTLDEQSQNMNLNARPPIPGTLAVDEKIMTTEPPAPVIRQNQRNIPIKVDRSTLTFRKPKSVMKNSGALSKTLYSAVQGLKHKVVEQLLDRGISPDTVDDGTNNINMLGDAVYNNDIPMAKLLLEFGADPNIPNRSDGLSPLHWATHRKIELVKLLLEYGADPHLQINDWFALNTALYLDKEDAVNLILQYGHDPNKSSRNGQNSVGYVCDMPEVKIFYLQKLIEWGGDVNQPNGNGIYPLAAACRKRRLDVVEVLLQNGVNINQVFKEDWNAIKIVCEENEPKILELLLSRGADPQRTDPKGIAMMALRGPECTSLLISHGLKIQHMPGTVSHAASWNLFKTLQVLLDAGGDINEKAGWGNTLLHKACDSNNTEAVEYLLARGVDPNARNSDGATPLVNTIHKPRLTKILINRGADLFRCPGLLGSAIHWQDMDMIKLFFEKGAKVNEKMDQGGFPLHHAAGYKRFNAFEYLLSIGADPNLKGEKGTAIWYCWDDVNYVKALIASGADVNQCVGILTEAAFWGNLDSLRYFLDEAKMDINAPNPNTGITALTIAYEHDKMSVVDELLARGADPNTPATDPKKLPLWKAVSNNRDISKLLAAGADPTKVDDLLKLAIECQATNATRLLLEDGRIVVDEKRSDGWSPLTQAAEMNNLALVTMLLDAKANINLATSSGRTALMAACQVGNVSMVQLLVDRGAQVDLVDSSGNTAMDIAAGRGHDEVVMLLLGGME